MRYTVTTFKVRLEVCDQGDCTAASNDAVRVARPIFAELDADKEHFVLLALNNKNRISLREDKDPKKVVREFSP